MRPAERWPRAIPSPAPGSPSTSPSPASSPSRAISQVSLLRWPSLDSLRTTRYPGRPVGQRKQVIPRFPAAGSVTATIIAMSAVEPAVMNDLVPSMVQPPPSAPRRARVRIAAASDPVWGSVRRIAPRYSPRASFGSQASFWAAVPCLATAAETGELLAAITFATPQSAAATSSIASTYETKSAPAPPCSGGTQTPISPTSPMRR